MKLLVLTRFSALGASSRLRFYQFEPALRESEIHLDFKPLFGDEYLKTKYQGKRISRLYILFSYLKRFILLLKIRGYDAVWFEKELFPGLPAFFEFFLLKLGVRMIVDFDDAVFHYYDQSSNAYLRLLKHKISRVISSSTYCICGSPYLLEYAEKLIGNRAILIPTVVDENRYIAKVHEVKPSRVRVCWVGTPETVFFLRAILPILKSAQEKADFDLVVIGAKIDESGLNCINLDWSEQTEVRDICSCDIGIMPLPDEPWARGKCAYKIIQYMACGLPVVASAVGANNFVVSHGKDGYLVSSSAQWEAALTQLITTEQLRREFGDTAHQKFLQLYSITAVVDRLRDALLCEEYSQTN
jgi:glycosyltransferase involved in cell wall biosynthesis